MSPAWLDAGFIQIGKLNVIQEISPSFIDFLSQRVAGDA
jgi:hypothetical protein